MPHFKVESVIRGNQQQLYSELITMAGVNYELMPIVRMTAPSIWAQKPISQWPVGRPLFNSLILLFGVLPVDRHCFELEEINVNGFHEASSSLTHTLWKHSRTIEQLNFGCRVTDELEFTPRLGFMGALLLPIYKFVFNHRHKRLKTRYGEAV